MGYQKQIRATVASDDASWTIKWQGEYFVILPPRDKFAIESNSYGHSTYGHHTLPVHLKRWHKWCEDEETREMAQIYLNLLGET